MSPKKPKVIFFLSLPLCSTKIKTYIKLVKLNEMGLNVIFSSLPQIFKKKIYPTCSSDGVLSDPLKTTLLISFLHVPVFVYYKVNWAWILNAMETTFYLQKTFTYFYFETLHNDGMVSLVTCMGHFPSPSFLLLPSFISI